VEHAGIAELLSESSLFLGVDSVQKLLQSVRLLFALLVSHNFHNDGVLLTELDNVRVEESYSEGFLSHFLRWSWQNLDLNSGLVFIMVEVKGSLGMIEISTWGSSVLTSINFFSLVLNVNNTI
jgi:hypothetical protein